MYPFSGSYQKMFSIKGSKPRKRKNPGNKDSSVRGAKRMKVKEDEIRVKEDPRLTAEQQAREQPVQTRAGRGFQKRGLQKSK